MDHTAAMLDDTAVADAPVAVRLLRPEAGTVVLAGTRVNGIGWVVSAAAVTAVHVELGGVRLGPARLGLSASDVALLTGHAPAGAISGHAPSGAMTGFVFTATIPDLPPGPVLLRLRIETVARHHDTEVKLILAAGPGAAPPVRAPFFTDTLGGMVETARIDERGLLRAAGWVVSVAPIAHLHIHLGERLLGEAQRGLLREDVAARYAQYPDARSAGFLLLAEMADADLAQPELRLVLTFGDGHRHSVTAPLERPARVQRRAPARLANLACEEVLLTETGRFAIKGWAVASSGVAAISIALDETVLGTVLPGEARPDVGNRYPRIAGARQAGFRWRHDLGARCAGDHVVRLTVRGRDGEENACVQTVTVQPEAAGETAAPPAPADGAAIRFHLDVPACQDGVAIETVRGFLSLSGWAFGRHGIDRIAVFVDGVPQGCAHHGIRRDDLRTAFPDDDTRLAGFAMVVPPQAMKPGEHRVRIDATDKAGRVHEHAILVRAAAAAEGPGPWMLRSKLPQAEIDLLHAILAAGDYAPRWTLIILARAGEAARAALHDTIRGLALQAYAAWTLVILAREADVARLRAVVAAVPEAVRDRLLVLAHSPDRDLADIAGDADFAAVLGAGDQLGEDALLELTLAALHDREADFLYSDERRTDPADGTVKAFFKPDFSPDLLLSTNYIGRLWAASPALLRAAGLRAGTLAAAGEYDAVLRLTERARRVRHVGKVLCARADMPREAPQRERRGERRALRQAMARRGIAGEVLAGPVPGSYRVRRKIIATGKVSIIIPTNAARDLIRTAIGSIRSHTAWPDYEIICLDNIPAAADAGQRRCKDWIAAHADRTIALADRFNWSRFNNIAAREARGDFLLFLNDDIEVTDPDWLHGLVEHAQRPEIGVVGPQLLYPDGRVQHAGVFLGRRAARHAFRFYPRDEPGPFGLARTQRDVISVTGACMMVRRAVFEALGGFDEAHAVINNDLDFSLRARGRGLGVVYTPAVSLVHHEMASRAGLADIHDAPRFAAVWGDLFLQGDPFFSRHFSPDHDDYVPDAEPVRHFVAGRPLFARAAIRRILAVKVDHIGDFVTAFPAFRRIKRHFPEAELTVLAATAARSLAALEPAIDRVIEFNFYHERSERGRQTIGRRQIAALRAQLAPAGFDLAIDLRRQPDTRMLLQASGARWLAGFDHGYQHPWLDIAVAFEGDVARCWKSQHVTDSLAGLVDAVAAQAEPDRRLVRDPPARDAARRFLARLLDQLAEARSDVLQDRPIVCVHTGAGAINKQWPAASFAGLIDLLAADPGAVMLIIGGKDEATFARDVIGRARRRHDIIDLVGRTALRALPDVLRAADLYVGNDSGPKHIAAAIGVPAIGIHSGSVDAGEWGAVGPFALTIRRDMTCSPCYLAHAADCHRGLACLDGIRVADVAEACRRMLALGTAT